MQLEILKKRFFAIVSPSLPNEWEVEDVLSHLLELSGEHVDNLLEQVAVIWPVSHSLCFAYLLDGVKCITCIPSDLIAEWSRQILGMYETGGLLAARKYMAEPERLFLGPMKGLCGVGFSQVSERMQLYLNGISGKQIQLGVAQRSQSDTGNILVPDFIDTFSAQSDNTLLYKFIISLQWTHIESRVFENYLEYDQSGPDNVGSWFTCFANPQKARDLFAILQFGKSFTRLADTLPGLVQKARPLCLELIAKISCVRGTTEYCLLLKHILQYFVTDMCEGAIAGKVLSGNLVTGLDRLYSETTFEVLPQLYDYIDQDDGDCEFSDFALILGDFNFDGAAVVIRKRREKEKDIFVALLAEALGEKDKDTGNVLSEINSRDSGNSSLMVIENEMDHDDGRELEEVLFENGRSELSEELKALINNIQDDLGELPQAYVQAASGMAGKGVNSRDSLEEGDNLPHAHLGILGHSYDEWDYRRGGYRSSWCTLYEKSVNPVKSMFVEDTLVKYKGPLHKIRRQFEMLRNQNRFVRRRRYGDDIDFDALVDALGDAKAGIIPSNRLFIRLLRDRREISSCFLVDMSNSTEGWVGTAVKESLVLMAEAMDIVGDPYAIYGFSGMRRSKSELFTIKELAEPYSTRVKERISGIGPKEYTRMGPPIRHLTKKILESDSRVRLLIVISDGKPEDYDDYKGQYAIEDTRKAILEARGVGVHVFCVTIDKTAHEYLGHMFGRGQFVFIDNVDALPGKLVELYRHLTQ
ncbi:MAG: nitric oxide reductase NorD protein [Desulforhopalus sp.]|jgi:nitric oxide reductase NorD protein